MQNIHQARNFTWILSLLRPFLSFLICLFLGRLIKQQGYKQFVFRKLELIRKFLTKLTHGGSSFGILFICSLQIDKLAVVMRLLGNIMLHQHIQCRLLLVILLRSTIHFRHGTQ